MWEFAPPWSNVRITKAQVRKYIADMKNAQKLARERLENAKNNWEFEKEEKEIKRLEDLLDEL